MQTSNNFQNYLPHIAHQKQTPLGKLKFILDSEAPYEV